MRLFLAHSNSKSLFPFNSIFFILCFFILGLNFIHAQDEDDDDKTPKIPHSIIDTFVGESISNSRQCFPVIAKASLPGGKDAYIELTYIDETPGILAVAMYNFFDQHLIGAVLPNTNEITYTCTTEAIGYGICTELHKILFRNTSKPLHGAIQSELIHFTSNQKELKLKYNVETTGIYCAIRLPIENMGDYISRIKVFNTHGGLPAEAFPKLPFFAVTCVVYTIVFILWMGKSIMHWKEILPVQLYIAGVIGFLSFETFIKYLYFRHWNITEEASYPLLFLSAIANAGRISISFFILAIVSMGYGVVKPSLGKDMLKCQILTGIHFLVGAIYAAMNLKDPRQQEYPILFVVVPLAMLMTIFYAWTLASLTATTQHLETRRQHFKLLMYQRLWHILLFAGINLVIFFIVQSIWLARNSDLVFLVNWWRWRWVMTDGWTNVLYTICFLAICYLWRPTTNNARYGLEQILSDPLEDEFDMDFSELYPTSSTGTHAPSLTKGPKSSFMMSSTMTSANQDTVFTLADSDDEVNYGSSTLGNTTSSSMYSHRPSSTRFNGHDEDEDERTGGKRSNPVSQTSSDYHRVNLRSRSSSPRRHIAVDLDPKLS